MSSLAQLKKGQKAVIRSITDPTLSTRLIDMGCLPGETITLSKTAPLGCPLAVRVAGYELTLRIEEAESVLVELVA